MATGALQILDDIGFAGFVLVPEPEDQQWPRDYLAQTEWELTGLEACEKSPRGCIAAWIPRDLNLMPGFTTNVEFGFLVKSGSLVYGRPDGAPKTRYLDWLYSRFNSSRIATTLNELIDAAVARTRIVD